MPAPPRRVAAQREPRRRRAAAMTAAARYGQDARRKSLDAISARVSQRQRLLRLLENLHDLRHDVDEEAGDDDDRDDRDERRVEQREAGLLLQRLARVEIVGEVLQHGRQRARFLAAVHERAVEVRESSSRRRRARRRVDRPAVISALTPVSTSRTTGRPLPRSARSSVCSIVSPDSSSVAICRVRTRKLAPPGCRGPTARRARARASDPARPLDGSSPCARTCCAPGAACRPAPRPRPCGRRRRAPRSGMPPSYSPGDAHDFLQAHHALRGPAHAVVAQRAHAARARRARAAPARRRGRGSGGAARRPPCSSS